MLKIAPKVKNNMALDRERKLERDRKPLDRGGRDTFAAKPLPKDARRHSNPDVPLAAPINPHNAYEENIDYSRWQGGHSHEGTRDNATEYNQSAGRGIRIASPAAKEAAIGENRFGRVSKPRSGRGGNYDVGESDETSERVRLTTKEWKKLAHETTGHNNGNIAYKYPARNPINPSMPGVPDVEGPSRKSQGSVVVGRRGTNSGAQARNGRRYDISKTYVGSKLGEKEK